MPDLFDTDVTRVNPYKPFTFKVKWGGAYVAGFNRVSTLTRTIQVVKHRAGGDFSSARLSPGQPDFDPITLERGVTHDPAFERWCNKIWYPPNQVGDGDSQLSAADFRKDIIVEMFNDAGQKVLAYTVYRCWPSEFRAMPDLDGGGRATAVESLTLQHEGFDRDTAIAEPRSEQDILQMSAQRRRFYLEMDG